MVEFLVIRVLTLSATKARIQIIVFTRIELPTSALVGVRGYLLDYSGDEGSLPWHSITYIFDTFPHRFYETVMLIPPKIRGKWSFQHQISVRFHASKISAVAHEEFTLQMCIDITR